ncbi:MAG: ribosome biogenesis GTP-binding protein YihA/YsxC [Deltaproteobacteria bacterium]|nr:ribosome biogenesis GTP-binding protein YihA/YsxC [Deltaproteobacteria bacterium]
MEFVLKSAEFLTSAGSPKGYPPPGPPEVAFAGRSNVGKSSLINCLVGQKKLVRVSSRPGRTQLINFFALNGGELCLVDLPGYGFAKVPPAVKASWRRMVESYLDGRETLRAVVVILDVRREPNNEDLMLLNYLNSLGVPAIVALTKSDKLSNNQLAARRRVLGPLLAAYDARPVVCSATTRLGRDELWRRVLAAAAAGAPEHDAPPPA